MKVNNNEIGPSVLSEVIKARYCMKNELLVSKDYTGLVSENYQITNVIYCEAKNISVSSSITNNDVFVSIEFDLVYAYEYVIAPKAPPSYGFHSERLKRTLRIQKNLYKYASNGEAFLDLKCRNEIKVIKYITDIDLTFSKVSIDIIINLESMLVHSEIILLAPEAALASKIEPYAAEVEADDTKSKKCSPNNEGASSLEDDMSDLYLSIGRMLSEMDGTKSSNIEYQSKFEDLERQIAYLENKCRSYDSEYNKLLSNSKSKDEEIGELKLQIRKKEESISELFNSKNDISLLLDAVSKENAELLEYIESEKSKSKQHLINRVKSVISSSKIF